MSIIRALFTVIIAILRSATSSFLLFTSVILSSVAALAVVAFAAVSLTGFVTVCIGRRRASRSSGS